VASAKVFYLPGQGGELFVCYYPPSTESGTKGHVVFVPPFAEEMNHSRRMISIQARRLSEIGYGAVVFDLYGTGDSGGDFADARWDLWKSDVATITEWILDQTSTAINLLGLRLGSLLAVDYAQHASKRPERIIMWQPIVSGQLFLNQFLRLRLVANMSRVGGNHAKESTQSLRRLLSQGESIEVAGYELNAEITTAIDSLSLRDLGAKLSTPLYWFELSISKDAPFSPASERVLTEWVRQGLDVTKKAVEGEPFWAIQETALTPTLVDATTELFEKGN
jgi:exosortase A-associated hydrolase 2